MNFGAKLKDKLYSISDKVEGIGAKQREKREAKKEIKQLRFNVQYESDKKYLAEQKEKNRMKETINLARQERQKNSFAGRLVAGASKMSSSSGKKRKPLANVNRSAFGSYGNVRTGTHDNSVLFGNVDNSILYRKGGRK